MNRSRRRLLLLLLTLLCGTAVHAQERLTGRMFFTAEQRAQLDAGRREAIANRNRPAPARAAPVPKAAPPQVVTLHGIVKRSDGESTVWVNGKPLSSQFRDADIGAGTITRDSVGLDVPGSKRRIRLKVGQSLEAMSGTIEEGYRRRRTLPTTAVPVEAPADAAEGTTGDAVPPAPPRRRRNRGDEDRNAGAGGDS